MSDPKKKMEEFCEHISDALQIGLMATHVDGEVCYINDTFAGMFNIDKKNAIGTNICQYFPGSELLNVIKYKKKELRVSFMYNGVEAFISRFPIFDGEECIGGYIEAYFRDMAELQSLLSRIAQLESKANYMEKRAKAGFPKSIFTFDDIVGESESIRNLKLQGLRFAKSYSPVRITGEAGTGKELLAHSIHSASPRAEQAFITVNCAAIPPELLEAELFGYTEGSFTGARRGGSIGKFELADNGTIFLDEIADVPLPMQAKLLRVLENHEIQKIGDSKPVISDFRVVAATNKNLADLVKNGKFRSDLYHRLEVLHLHSPALRDRLEDLPYLVADLLRKISLQEHCSVPKVEDDVYMYLRQYNWPGNVRELKNVLISSRLALDDSNTIRKESLPSTLFSHCPLLHDKGPSTLRAACDECMRQTIKRALSRNFGNKVKTANELNISRNELYKKMKKLQIE